MPHMHHTAFESSSVSATLILLALVYVRGWIRIRRLNHDTIDSWRGGSFFLGLFSIWLAMASPVAALDHELLTVHMVQHLLLMTIAPPLIWLGEPVKPLSYGLPQLVQVQISRLFRSAPSQQLGKTLLQPKICWLAAAGTLVGWHVPALFMFGMRSEVLHAMEQASFLIAGLLFWCPVLRPWPMASNWSAWPVLLYLFLATLPCDILSGFLVFCDRSVYPTYSSVAHPLGLSALDDQQLAAALMWTCVTVVYLIAGTLWTARLLSPEWLRPYRVDAQFSTLRRANRHNTEVV